MRVTSEIRGYILKQIVAKVQPKLDAINIAIKSEVDSMNKKVEDVSRHLNAKVESLREGIVEYAKAYGLTARDTLSWRLHISEDDFVETHTDYHEDKPRYHNNKRYCKLWEDRRKLSEKINDSVIEIVFKLEAGAKRGEIEEMLASIKF